MLYHDVLIVGGGLAGLRAAVGLCDKYNVGLLSKVYPIRSHSIAAQGGINAALANNPNAKDDTWEKHTFDTVKGSDYLADQHAVEIMCKEALRLCMRWNTGDVPSAGSLMAPLPRDPSVAQAIQGHAIRQI